MMSAYIGDDIFYTAAKPGTYVIYVRFGGVDIPNSPFTVMVRKLPSLEHAVVSTDSNSCWLLNPNWDFLGQFFFFFCLNKKKKSP